MKIPYFNLKGARDMVVSTVKPSPKSTSRRQFVRMLGLGAVTVNPALETISNLAGEPFTLSTGPGLVRIERAGQTAWEIRTETFEQGAELTCQAIRNGWQFSLARASVPGISLLWDMEGRIYRDKGRWMLEMVMPQFDVRSSVSLEDFLDRKKVLQAGCNVTAVAAELSGNNQIRLKAASSWKLTPEWEMTFSGDGCTELLYGGCSYLSGSMTVQPGARANFRFLHPAVKTGNLLTMPGFSDFNRLIGSFSYYGQSPFSWENTHPDLRFFCATTRKSGKVKVLWTESPEENLVMQGVNHSSFRFRNLFFSLWFSGLSNPGVYLSACLGEKGQWISPPIGSFRFIPRGDLPDLEAFGTGSEIESQLFETRLKAFHPRMEGAQTRVSVFSDAPLIRIEDQQPVRRTVAPNVRNLPAPTATSPQPPEEEAKPQDPVKRTQVATPAKTTQPQQPVRPATQPQEPVRQATQPSIEVAFDKIRFRPRKAMTIKILRPEDLVWLEFEFHNFRFSNRGQSSFLELENAREQGVVVIQFPTQHTLEEAWYEVTQMDSGSTQAVNLPARHIRAQRSRLVYELEAGHPGFELTMEQLMDWTKFKLRVHPRAWIKIPQIAVPRPLGVAAGKQAITTPALKNLTVTSGTNDYRVRMAEHAPSKMAQTAVYSETNLSGVLAADKLASIRPSFDISSLRADMNVGPVPPLSTSIEVPAMLYISPNQLNDFTHKTEPRFRDTEEAKPTEQVITAQFRVLDPLNTNRGEITELWHTTLGVKLGNRKISLLSLPALKTIRALWAYDAKEDYKGCALIDEPFQASLDANDRHKLVHTTSNYSIQGFTPFPVPIKQLMLTTLGAYIDLHAFFDVPSPADTWLNVIEWQHMATLGRDHYVKIVREGYLFPLGHRAALVKVTERKFDKTTKAAVNRMRMYIVVLQKEVLYDRNDPAGKFIKYPFQSARIGNDTTPDIDKPENVMPESKLKPIRIPAGPSDCPQKPGRSSTYNFFIYVNQKGFPFDVTFTDKEGAEHQVKMPMAFVENVSGRTKNLVDMMVAAYNPKKDFTDVSFAGQQLAYAPALVEGDTTFETEELTFGAQYYPAPGEADLKFHPVMQSARVFIKQVDELTGRRNPAAIQLEDDDNEGQVFASVSGAVVDFTGGSDKSGGFASPNMAITGLSKLQGPVGGKVEDMMNLDFIPSEFFKAMESLPMGKIFGVIDIFSLLLDKPDIKGSFAPMINQVKAARQEIDKLKNDILMLQNEAKETGNNLGSQIAQIKNEIKTQVDKLLKALNDQVPRVPNLKTWVTPEAFYAEYRWIPEFSGQKISLFDGILDVYVDKPKEALQITTTFKKPLDGILSASLNGNATFAGFGIRIVDALQVNFTSMSFLTGSSQKTDVRVDLNKSKPIEFVGALSFVNKLQSLIPSGGFSDDGPYIELTAAGVKAGFNLSVPNVEVGIFMLSNITLGAYVNLPFNGDELTMGFNFCKRENPFILTISCFGGGGYFMMVTTLKGLKSVEAAFEFGAAVSLNLGVASGGVKVVGGFYFKFEIVESGMEQITLTGYIRINGCLSVLGIITLSMEFYLSLTAVFVEKAIGPGETAKKVEKMEGVATLKVKIEVLFFSSTVSVTVRRQFAGADADPTFAQMITEEDWQEYCLAFEG